MLPTATNICLQCLSSTIDITEGISTKGTLLKCNQCDRYYGPPWQSCAPESRELMAFCLKKIKGLEKVKLIDSDFIWTEAHSKRIKIRMKIQREVQIKLSLESTLTIEFTEKNFQCDDCKKTWTPNKWKAIVQLRQKANSKQTIFFLEQLIIKHGMHKKTNNIKEMPDGLDFCFATKVLAGEFAAFIQSQIITKVKQSKQLISADLSSNEYNYVYTFSVELPSVSKGDLVIIPPKLQRELGGASTLCLVLKVASLIHLFDPIKVKIHTLDSKCYWNYELLPVCTRSQLTEYVVQSIGNSSGGTAEYSFVDLRLCRVSDTNVINKRLHAESHLGRILKNNDKVLAYDLSVITNGDLELKKMQGLDVVVVKKSYSDKEKKSKLKLNRLDKEKVLGKKENKWQVEREEKEYEEFERDLEEQEEMEKQQTTVYQLY